MVEICQFSGDEASSNSLHFFEHLLLKSKSQKQRWWQMGEPPSSVAFVWAHCKEYKMRGTIQDGIRASFLSRHLPQLQPLMGQQDTYEVHVVEKAAFSMTWRIQENMRLNSRYLYTMT